MKIFKKIATAYAAVKLSQAAYGGFAHTLSNFGAAREASDCSALAADFARNADECSKFADKYDELFELMDDPKARAILRKASKLGVGGMRLLAAYCDRTSTGLGSPSPFMAAQSEALCDGWDALRHSMLNPSDDALAPSHRRIAIQHCAVAVSCIGIAARTIALDLKAQGLLDPQQAERLADRVRRSEQDMLRLSNAAEPQAEAADANANANLADKLARRQADMGARSEMAQIHFLSGNLERAREIIEGSLSGKQGPDLEACLQGWDREMTPARGNETSFIQWCPALLAPLRQHAAATPRPPAP